MSSYIDWRTGQPVANIHPRIWVSDAHGTTLAPTLAVLRARRTSSDYVAFWNSLKSYNDGHLGSAWSYFDGKDPEYSGAYAFAYMVDPTRTGDRDKAISIANSIPATPSDSYSTRRRNMAALAYIYDWLRGGGYTNATFLHNCREKLATYIAMHLTISPQDYMWGTSRMGTQFAIMAVAAMINDVVGDETYHDGGYLTLTNAKVIEWMDTLMDNHDIGDASYPGILPINRFFGDTDGGTFKGSGQMSYDNRDNEIWVPLIPCMSSTFGVEWWTTEAWWLKQGWWNLAHWRVDRGSHHQNEQEQFAHYGLHQQGRLLQIAYMSDNDLGKMCQWYAQECQNAGALGYQLWGPYRIWSMLWYSPTRQAALKVPTPTLMGSSMRYFAAAGKACFHDTFEIPAIVGHPCQGTSMTLSCPRYFTGDHQQQEAGHFELATHGKRMILAPHAFNADDSHYKGYPYPNPSDPEDYSGFRFVYCARLISKNTIRIMDSDEYAENTVPSYRRQTGTAQEFGWYDSSSVFHPENSGDALWPKAAGLSGVNTYAPSDIRYVDPGNPLAVAAWDRGAFRHTSTSAMYSYTCCDMTQHYYAPKRTRVRRHVVWINPGFIPEWYEHPVIVMWDDIEAHIDGTFGAQTTKWNMHTWYQNTTSFTPAAFSITRSQEAKVHFKFLKPATASSRVVRGFKGEAFTNGTQTAYYDLGSNISYIDDTDSVPDSFGFYEPVCETGDDRDSTRTGNSIARYEVWPTTASTTPEFLVVMFPCGYSDPAAPTVTIHIDDASWIGVKIGATFTVKIARGDTHSAVVGNDDPPAAPTSLSATPFSQTRIDLIWTAPADTDLDPTYPYHVFKSTWSGSAWGDWSSAIDCATTSYSATGLTAATTYRFKVAAVDAAAQQGADSNIASATTNSIITESGTGAGISPWRSAGRFSKFNLRSR